MKKLFVSLILLWVSQTQAITSIFNAFNAGELSPMAEARTDLRRFYSGCRTLENMYVTPLGGVSKRPGTYYIASAKTASVLCRVMSYEHSIVQAYIIEAGNEYFRFYKDGGQILEDASASAYEIATPYLTADLLELQYIQSADVMYIVHNDYAPRKLTRTGHTAWTLNEADFQRGPFLKENKTATTITPSATTGSITLTASTSIFDSDHVGSSWRITHTVSTDSTSGIFTTTGNSSTVTAQYKRMVGFTLRGRWTGTVLLQRSYDAGSTWKDVRPFTSYGANEGISWREPENVDDAIYRLSATSLTDGTCEYTLMADSFDVEGVVEITAYTSGTVVTGTVDYTLGGTSAVTRWSEGAWSVYRGYPGTIAFYGERVAYGGTIYDPQTIWLSKTDDWENFLEGGDDTDALIYTFASDQINAVRWMVPQNALLIGTMGAEWKLSAARPDEPLTPYNYVVKRQSTNGSAALQAIVVNNHVLFAQRQTRKVRQFKYSFDLDTWVAADITILSEHITESGITSMAFQKTPQAILWCTRADGTLIGLSYEEDQQVIGWHRHITDGDIESVAVIAGPAEDEVWLSVKRTIEDVDYRYIEQMQPFNWGIDQNDVFFVDSGLSYTPAAEETIGSVLQTYPLYITVSDGAHSFSVGDQLRVTATGIPEADNQVFTIFGLNGADMMSFSTSANDGTVIDATGWDFSAYTGTGTLSQVENTFTTLDHLEGKTVTICGEGGYVGTETVSSGTVTLANFYDRVHIGLPYTAKVKPMKLEFPNTAGQLQGRNKRITATTVRLYKTLGCDIGPSWTVYDSYVFRDASDPLEAPPPLAGLSEAEDKRMLFRGSYDRSGDIYVQNRLPLPFTLLALIVEYDVY